MIKAIEQKRAAAYLRCSTDKQELSTEHQRSEILRLATPDGFHVTVVEADEGVSGTSLKGRSGLERLLREAMSPQRRFDYILVYNYSRLSRGTPFEAIALLQRLRDVGVEVISVTEPLSGSDFDYLMVPLRQMEAHTAVKTTSKNTILGQAKRASEGAWIGGAPPYGYDLAYVSAKGDVYARIRSLESGERALLKPDGSLDRMLAKKERLARSNADRTRLVLGLPDRVALVRRIFTLYVEGYGYKAIADRLNQEGILSPRNGNYSHKARAGWSRSTIKSILDNPAYTGDGAWNRRTGAKFHRRLGGQTVERPLAEMAKVKVNDPSDYVHADNAHPAIIDRETFESAHRIQRHRRTAPPHRTGRSKDSPYLLSGKIRCTNCNHAYIGDRRDRGKRRKDGTVVRTHYYVCAGYDSKGRTVCVKAPPLAKDVIESAVRQGIQNCITVFLDEGGDAILRQVVTAALSPSPVFDDRRREWEGRLVEIDRRIDELMDSLTPTNKEFVDRKLEVLKAERDPLRDRLADLDIQQRQTSNLDVLIEGSMASMREFDGIFAEGSLEEQKELMSVMVEKVDVDPVGRTARCYIRKFPAPSCLDTGNRSRLVAGVRDEQQKVVFPPIDVVEIPLVARGTVLVPLAA